MRKVVIAGVGLIGGSIGLALKARPDCPIIVGLSRSRDSLARALERNAIDIAGDYVDPPIADADLVIACAPVDQIVSQLEQLKPHLGNDCLVTDVGSTKREVVMGAEKLFDKLGPRFVGSHPIAGSEQSGIEAASENLFEGKVCVVTPTSHSHREAVASVFQFWQLLGMVTKVLTPLEHDEILALTSHLPHMMASVLACMLDERTKPFVGTGFRDTTRLASGDPVLWKAICSQNAGALREALDNLKQRMDGLIEDLARRDFEAVERKLREGKIIRDALGN